MQKLAGLTQPEPVDPPRFRFREQNLSGQRHERSIPSRPEAPRRLPLVSKKTLTIRIAVIIENPAVAADENMVADMVRRRLDPAYLAARRAMALQKCMRENVACAAGEKYAIGQTPTLDLIAF